MFCFVGLSSILNSLSTEQIHRHKQVLGKFIAAEDEEDDPYVSNDDDDVDIFLLMAERLSDADNEVKVEELFEN